MIDFRTLDGRADFYFLRHGESEGNSARLIQGRADYPLAEAGREQARRVAGWFADKQVQLLLCSPLSRAAETARIVAAELDLPGPEPRPELTEIDTGLFTGLTTAVIQEKFPADWRSFQRESWEGVPGAERVAALTARSERLWSELAELARQGMRSILCVTHSGAMQWVLKASFGCRTWMPVVPIGNCAVCRFSVDNRLSEEPVRYYAEWSALNYRPFREQEGDDP